MEKKMDSSLRSFRDGTVQKPHSLKIPSNKKSSAFPGVQSQLPSTRPPFQRPTSHMWNRRGRLKELRIRCMARKFLYLWIQKTFGRIFPSKARLYCQRKVLRKVFREWKEEWWISHREWKLCIRADCHYRYYLYNLTFQTWRAYVHQQQEMRNKYMRAEDHGEKRRQRPLEMVPKCNFVEALEKEKHIDYLLLFSRRHVNLYAEQIIREAGLYEEEHGVRIGGRCINNLPYADDTTLLAESEEDLKVLLQRLTDCRVQHGLTIFRLCQQTMRRAWKSWLIYVVVRRTKLQMQTAAVEFRQQSTLWVWWRVWRRSLGEVHMCRALHASAVKHRDRSLQLQAWSRWWEQLLRVWRDRQKMACALKHHQHVQKRSSLRAWLEYLQLRRVKRLKEEMAAQFHRVHVLQTHFCGWQQAQKWRENLYAHRVLVEALARRMVLRRAFTHWKCYVLMCAEAATQCKMAEEHHRRRLLTFCLRVLQDNVARARLQQIRRNLAHQQHEAVLLRRCWHAWLCRVEQREEQKQSSLLRDARAHYRVTVLHKCFTLWLLRTQKSRSKQMLQARADSHFQRRALPAAFQAWRRRWQQHQHSRALNVRAARFHREMLERQVLVIWWQKMFQHRENRLAERVAILHSEQQLLLRAWSMWRQQAAAHHQEQQRHALACVHHQHWQLRRAFRVWRESAQGHRTEKLGKAQAVEFHSLQLLRGTWNRWRECLAMLQVERQKLVLADLHHQSSLLRRVLRRWLTYQDKVRHVLREVAARESRHNRHLLRAALRHWRKNTVVRVDEAKKAFQAYEHYTRTICSKVLAQWREAASIQIYYRQQEDSAISEARVVLDRGCVRTAFLRWRNHSWSAARQRTQMERAAQHQTRQLLRGAVSRWKAYYRGRIRKTLLQRRGAQFLVQRLSQFCFHQWSQQLAARREEQRSTARALWFWSFSLQAKAWDAWLDFVLERRRKKERLEQAVQAYHQQLLHSGVTCLLRFAAHSKASRQQLLAQQQAQVAHSLHRTVLRCAMLWKRKALGEAREPRPLVSSRRATFKVPRLGGITDGAGNTTTMEAKTQGTRPRGGLDSLALAAGDAPLLELNVARPERKQPRCPNFLLELEQSQKIVGCGPVREQKAELEPGFRMAPVASSSLTQPFLVETQRALVPQGPLSEPRARPRPPGPRLPPPASTDAELVLLPPSSFTLPRADTPAGVPSARPGRPHLLLPGDFTGAGAHPGLGSEVAGSPELEIELEGIRQQLQNYQSTKQNLGSCRRQAHSLRRWLELSREEPQPEDQEVEQQVQKELEEVEAQIQHLATELRAQRQPIRACIARVQALRQALR